MPSESSAGVLSRLLLVNPLRHSPSISHRALPLPRPPPPSHHMTNPSRASTCPTAHTPPPPIEVVQPSPTVTAPAVIQPLIIPPPLPPPSVPLRLSDRPTDPLLRAHASLPKAMAPEPALCHAGNSPDLYRRDTMQPAGGKARAPGACNKRLSLEAITRQV